MTSVRSTRRRRLSRPHRPRKAVARIESWIQHTRLASDDDTTITPQKTASTKRCHKSSFSRATRRQRKVSLRQCHTPVKMIREVHFVEEPLAEEEQISIPPPSEGLSHPALVLLIFGFAIGTLLPLILLLLAFAAVLHFAPLMNEETSENQVSSDLISDLGRLLTVHRCRTCLVPPEALKCWNPLRSTARCSRAQISRCGGRG